MHFGRRRDAGDILNGDGTVHLPPIGEDGAHGTGDTRARQDAAVVEVDELIGGVRLEVDHIAGVGAVVNVEAGDVVARIDDRDGPRRRKRTWRTSRIGVSGRGPKQAPDPQRRGERGASGRDLRSVGPNRSVMVRGVLACAAQSARRTRRVPCL